MNSKTSILLTQVCRQPGVYMASVAKHQVSPSIVCCQGNTLSFSAICSEISLTPDSLRWDKPHTIILADSVCERAHAGGSTDELRQTVIIVSL